jgi:hypothetical protein
MDAALHAAGCLECSNVLSFAAVLFFIIIALPIIYQSLSTLVCLCCAMILGYVPVCLFVCLFFVDINNAIEL